MPLASTPRSYGGPARLFHWLTALLIVTAAALGLCATGLPTGSPEQVAAAVTAFSAHKTIGVAAFFVALARILWAVTQPRPAPLHPARRLETLAAETVHWALYGAMLVMPLSGWVKHAAQAGFAPIWGPFGQGLPFVPQSAALAQAAGAVHGLAAWVLGAAVALHVAGALKHALIDRDATLARMTHGLAAGSGAHRAGRAAPALALSIWAGVMGVAVLPGAATRPDTPTAPAQIDSADIWQVQEGRLSFTVRQMGAEVTGSFADWQAQIDYTPETRAGQVTVDIALASLGLGAVTAQALGPEFLDAASHPTARFSAAIGETDGQLAATGRLELRGATMPVTLPFTLEMVDGTARMTGTTTLDRRDFGIGAGYGDEATVGFDVRVDVALTATRSSTTNN